jgi:hypothetical protein
MTAATTGNCAKHPQRVSRPHSFVELIQEERRRIDSDRRRNPSSVLGVSDDATLNLADDVIPLAGPADEPWVAFTDRDYFGLSLSGGGIRSATFNLGLLQALEQNGVLGHIDYLSTVSGGGYIGGFWTAWRHLRRSIANADNDSGQCSLFPLSSAKLDDAASTACVDENARLRERVDRREPPQIRHLREFSRFLMPRVGFQHAETWGGVVALLGGLVPSSLAAVALLAVTFYAWYALAFLLAWLPWHHGWVIAGAFALATGVLHWAKESNFRSTNQRTDHFVISSEMLVILIGSSLVSGVLFWALREHWLRAANDEWLRMAQATWAGQQAHDTVVKHQFSSALFGAPLAWAATGLGLSLFRGFGARFCRNAKRRILLSNAYERTAARHLVYALVFAALGLVWELARYLLQDKPWGYSLTASSSVGFAALFAGLRNWLSKPVEPTRGSKWLDRLVTLGKPLMPQVAANVAFLSILTGMALVVQTWDGKAHILWGVFSAFVVIFITVTLFDPARTGLHDFYRSRIARCFLGAAHVEPNGRLLRVTPEQPDDDVTLAAIRGDMTPLRPVHLICCAANSLSGDVLGSLYRGARSAVVSPLAISIGGHCAEPPSDLRLSSALTASAAAFNSQMGGLSMRLGPAVAFLMSALNLRLGLWVPHPLSGVNGEYKYLRGMQFFLEMLGLTKCDPVGDKSELGILGNHVHLSDGGHFENLGFYELVRRHCRYVIVSDCGADPDYVFDDLGNAIRRIREDFNIEIELDTGPLCPDANGRAAQHAVVGTIHYDGLSGTDKGMLLYFKPTLTGDEPLDVLQYRVRNSTFPNEGTGDQFYDEAQWESYRRLGEHAVHGVLRSLDDTVCQGSPVDRLFLEASQRWHPQLERQQEIYQDLNQRCAEFLANVQQNAPATLRAELFPEVAATFRADHAQSDVVATRSSEQTHFEAATRDETTQVLFFLTLALQLMEEAWITAKLDTFWSHPLNEGWMHYFERWASTASLRRYWPILRPMYSPGFRDFVRDRFNLRLNEQARDESNRGANLRLWPLTASTGTTLELEKLLTASGAFVWQQWQLRRSLPLNEGSNALLYEITLDRLGEQSFEPLQVGLLLYSLRSEGAIVEWRVSDLYVPPSLNGAGIVARFLDAIVRYFATIERTQEIIVVVDDANVQVPCSSRRSARGLDAAGRQAKIHDISFYKSRGFAYWRQPGDAGQPRALKLDLDQLRARERR